MYRFANEDGTCTSALAATSDALAVGSESGVVSLYADGLPSDRSQVGNPTLSKAFMNLTTKVDSLAFHPSGQLLAAGSSEVTLSTF